MKPLTKEQIAEMCALLAPHGLVVKPAPKPRRTAMDRLDRIRAWKPETAAGRACKSNMLWLARLGPIEGVKDYRVMGSDNQWHAEGDPGFERAVEWQKLCYEWRV